MSAARYYLAPNGNGTSRMLGKPGGGHIEIGMEVLAANGIVPNDQVDVYKQMFRLKFVRVVEHDDGSVEVEHGPELTAAQSLVIERLRGNGKRISMIKARFG